MYRRSILVVLLVVSLAGCADANYGIQRALLGIDCQQKQADGQCAKTR